MNAQKRKFFRKLLDVKRWMDGKLINVADQMRAWRTDFFCKINRRGATYIRQFRVKIVSKLVIEMCVTLIAFYKGQKGK